MAAQRNMRGRVGEISERDLQIYQLAGSGTRTQRDLAVEFQLSGARIHAILARVHNLLGARAKEQNEANRAQRIQAVRAWHAAQLESLYEETMQAWEQSQLPRVTIQVREVNGEVTSVTRTTTTQRGDRRWLTEATKIACQLADFQSQEQPRKRTKIPSRVVDSSAFNSQQAHANSANTGELICRANIEQPKPNSPEVSPQ